MQTNKQSPLPPPPHTHTHNDKQTDKETYKQTNKYQQYYILLCTTLLSYIQTEDAQQILM